MTPLRLERGQKRTAKAEALPEVAGDQKKELDAGCRRLSDGMSGVISPTDPCTAEVVCRVAQCFHGSSLVPPWVSVGHFPGASELRSCICVTIRARLLASSIVRSFHDRGTQGEPGGHLVSPEVIRVLE